LLIEQRQSPAAQYYSVNTCQTLPVVPKTLSDNSFNQIAINRSPDVFLGDCQTEPALLKIITTPENSKKVVGRSIRPFKYPTV